MKKEKDISLQEIFMAKAGKAGWDKTFMGTIRRTKDVVYGKVKVNNKIIQASAKDQWELGEKLDELVLIALHGENLFQKSGTGISLN